MQNTVNPVSDPAFVNKRFDMDIRSIALDGMADNDGNDFRNRSGFNNLIQLGYLFSLPRFRAEFGLSEIQSLTDLLFNAFIAFIAQLKANR